MDNHFKKCALLGDPVAHSKSPIMMNGWIKQYGVKGHYEAIECPPDDLEKTLKGLLEEGYAGFNVTLPHKKSIRSYCDFFGQEACEIGAVNTLHFKEDMLYGTNTDAYGFIKNLEYAHPDFNWSAGPAVILGAGGAARAIAYALKEKNVPRVTICNRTLSKASDIVADMGGSVMPWDARTDSLKDCALLINTTSLGMTGKQSLNMPLEALPSEALVYDIVYAPLMTPLLQEAQSRGNPVVTGIGMLLYQGQKSFETWFGLCPEIDDTLIKKMLA